MSQVIHGKGETAETLAELYLPIREELGQVEEILRRELTSDHAFVDRLVKHGFRLGGKRLRPALVLLSGKVCGEISKDHFTLAAAVELIHTATLIHDDVLDEASMRRHLDTVNARWDNEASVLLGDYLLARSIGLVGTVDTTFACEVIGTASREMCEGELRQIGARGNYELKESEYLEIIGAKTAALCACCCRLGAHYSGASEEAQQSLARYGRHLGLAFQVVDDVLDVFGDEATMGKSLGTDLIKQKATLPLIRLLEKADDVDRAKLMTILSNSDNHRRETLYPWFEKYDAIEYSRQKAVELTHLASTELGSLPKGPIVDTLHRLAKFVISRRQ
ncbi:MAG: polyprenyl synthetase family protein [Pirellulales bacterium]|nr:polyprenyl synthetase family protein [Pirellulales bacterium]